MNKTFYSHLIEIDVLYSYISKITNDETERHHLILLVDSSIDTAVIHLVVSEIRSEENKLLFLESVKNGDRDGIRRILQNIQGIEGRIRERAHSIRDSFLEDINSLR